MPETSKIRDKISKYVHGTVFDIGCGNDKKIDLEIFPIHFAQAGNAAVHFAVGDEEGQLVAQGQAERLGDALFNR